MMITSFSPIFFVWAFLLLPSSLALAKGKAAAASPSSGEVSSKRSNFEESQSKKVIYKDKTTVNFDDTSITGDRKNPFASMLNSRDQQFNRGFIHIRKNWHDKMIMSVQGLNQ